MKEVIKALKVQLRDLAKQTKNINSAIAKLGGQKKARKPRAAKAEKVEKPAKAKAEKKEAVAA